MNKSAALISLLALSAAACASHDGADARENIGTNEAAIINGIPVSPEGSGFVLVTSPAGGCSGTLLTNQVVIAAKHCFWRTDITPPTRVAPSEVKLTMGSQVLSGAAIEEHPTDTAAVGAAMAATSA